MRNAAPVIIVEQVSDRPAEWRRFVAGLCFFEFYGQFVWYGRELVLCYFDPGTWSVLKPVAFPWATLASLTRAVAFLLLGRVLWLSRGRLWLWLLTTAALWLFALWGEIRSALDGAVWPGALFPNAGLRILCTCLTSLPWLAMLLIGGWHVRSCRRPRSRSWVVFAAIWCAGMTVFNFPPAYFANPTGRGWCEFLSKPTMDVALAPTPLLVAALLLMHWKYARTAALAAAAIQILATVVWPGVLMLLVGVAIKALFIASRVEIWPWTNVIFSRNIFDALFVDLVANAGPWLLIAWYAWRVPMKALPDDGSPYPRRYCGRCYYNLHGIEVGACPECGAVLESPDREPNSGGVVSASAAAH